MAVSVNEAQEEPEDEGEEAAAGAYSTPVERPRQQARSSACGRDMPDRCARAARRGMPVERTIDAQEEHGGTVEANAVADPSAVEAGGLSHQQPQLGIVRNRESCDQRCRDTDG